MSDPIPSFHYDIAIAGSGFTGVYAARTLRRKLGREGAGKVALISDQNFLLFQPMLAEVCGSSISPLHVVNSTRLLCRDVNVLRSEITGIDLPSRTLTLNSGLYAGNARVTFDHLVLSVGSIVDVSRVPGMAEHGFLMKTVGDAMRLRTSLIDRMEEASLVRDEAALRRLLTFVVIGGGYSGVETAGQLMDLLQGSLRYFPALNPSYFRVVLVHSGAHLMPTIGEKLGAYAERKLRERGLTVLLNTRVRALTATKVFLDHGDPIESHTVVTTVGNAPHPLLLDLIRKHGLENDHGRIAVDAQLRVKGLENVWAAGDCAAVPAKAGGTCPATAQFALRQGSLIGRNVAASLAGKPLQPFTFQSLGELAAIGHHTAVAEILGMRFSGLPAWLMWRAIYLGKLPGLDRKLHVLIDWVFDLFFPREISLLRGAVSAPLREMHLEKGDAVGHPGDPARSLYIVKEGRIDLTDGQGLVRSVGAGDYFGEMALLANKPWIFTATATETTTLVALDAVSFHALAGASQSIQRFFEKSSRRFSQRAELGQRMAALPLELFDTQARALMTSPVTTLRQGMPLREALAIAREKHFASYPVLDGNGKALGIVEHADLTDVARHPDEGATLDAVPLLPCPSVLEDTPVPTLLERFARSGAPKLLVTTPDGCLVGVLSQLDLAAARVRLDEPNSNGG